MYDNGRGGIRQECRLECDTSQINISDISFRRLHIETDNMRRPVERFLSEIFDNAYVGSLD